MQAVILLRVGVDNASIRRARAAVGKVWTGGQVGRLLGNSQGTARLDAQAVRTKAAAFHRFFGRTDGHAVIEPQRASIAQVTFVTFIEGNDERHMPALGSQAEQADGIVGSIKGSGEDGQAKDITTTIERGHAKDAIVAAAVGNGDDKGKLTGMA